MSETVIMGAGPAGLAAGYYLQKNNIKSTIFEADNQVGGISKTIEYKGYYFDLGGHRFFTKFDEVNELWNEILGGDFRRTPRLSRIYYNNKYFNYPLTPANALFGVGITNTILIVSSYIISKLFPYPEENTFEEWVCNRFGRKLYSMFFKTYTEKVWGMPCSEIQSEWAAQRIKGLSLASAVKNAFFKPQKTDIKTLINEFDYPIYGPGMMYTRMKNRIENLGGTVKLKSRVTRVNHRNFRVESIEYIDSTGKKKTKIGTDFVSSIPITELAQILYPAVDSTIIEAARKLKYRSLITIDIIINKKNIFPDNWIYIHSPEVRLGRIQNFKNWSPDMVPDIEKTSLGLEYFCTENDELWNMTDYELLELAASEVEKIKICEKDDIEDYTIVRVPKAYPVYMKGYRDYSDRIKEYLKKFNNLQLTGRYGLFKYNNMDHSIMTGLMAARNIIDGRNSFDTWRINNEEEYHEEKHA